MGTLTSRDAKRRVLVSVLGLLAYVVLGYLAHSILRTAVEGVITVGLLNVFSLVFDKRKPDEKPEDR
jgi:hypothetical protein